MSRPDVLRQRDDWVEAVFTSTLKPLERLVALAYADHARDGLTGVWVTGSRLLERTGLSRDAAYRALAGLERAGWFTVERRGRQQHSTRYALSTPTPQQSVSQTAQQSATQTAQQSASRTAEPGSTPDGLPGSPSPDTSSPSPDTSSPADGQDLSSYRSPHPPRAGEAPGEPAAEAAVPPAAARTSVPPQTTDPRRAEVLAAAMAAGDVPSDLLMDVVDLALADTKTRSPAGRMRTAPIWRARLVTQALAGRSGGAQEAGERLSERAAKCADLLARLRAAGEEGDRALATARSALGRSLDGPVEADLQLLREATSELAELRMGVGA